MTGRTSAEAHGSQPGAAQEGFRLLAQQHHQPKALSEFLDEWVEETGAPDPEDVAAMRRRYFPQ